MKAPVVWQEKSTAKHFSLPSLVRSYPVPVFFIVFCSLLVAASGKPVSFLLGELIIRLSRNSFTTLSLIIPVIAGLGLNFGIVLGAMAGQIALIIVTHYALPGMLGFLTAVLISTPFAMLFGWLAGRLLNRAKGREMITSMILGFFANGIYQLIFLVGIGTIIPMKNETMVIPGGIGLRNMFDLKYMKYALDNVLLLRFGRILIPVVTFLCVAALCMAIQFLLKTKLGQEFRAVGQDRHIAEVAGIKVDKIRIVAIMMSTTLAAWGQLIFLQNIGTVNTYNSHEQVGTFAIAALLVGGATVERANIGHALLGTLLFHTLFIISPYAGQRMFGSPQVGEYFRSFVAYGIIAVALAIHAWQSRKKAEAKG